MIKKDLPQSRETYFVEIILPLNVKGSFTYRVPFELNQSIQVGKRAIIQFGKSKIYTGIIISITHTVPHLHEAKYVLDIIDDYPIINSYQLKLFYWIADYYLCEWGEVLQAALPSALKLASETRVLLNNEIEIDKDNLTDKEFLIVDALDIKTELLVSEISKIVNQKNVFTILRNLYDKGIIHIYEDVQPKFKPKLISVLQLNDIYNDDNQFKLLFNLLENKPQQLNVLLAYIKLKRQNIHITKKALAEEANVTTNTILTLIKKQIFKVNSMNVSRFSLKNENPLNEFQLTDDQESAYNAILHSFRINKVALLHGVTSSGKTLVFIKLIKKALESGKQILYLLPEIALTSQIVNRLQCYFNDKILVYHSKFNDNERAEIWQKVLKNESLIILGARSSIFLPFENLGLIIVDEEHEASFKQHDPSPRYNARDVAIILAKLHKANILLGSATPSIESFYQTKDRKYALINLNKRFGGVQLPETKIVSLSEDLHTAYPNQYFTKTLINAIQNAIDNKEQVILFQNRRGYVPIVICKTCGFTPKCVHCDVSLTYHKSSNKLHCHYCGYKQDNMSVCNSCGSSYLEQKGFGTEKVEEVIKEIFPNAKVARMDYDTTRNKLGHEKILYEFENGDFDILVGTQMVAKGIDFNNVSTIGVINADSMLKFPDFRAYERSFQILSQVAGRAGRRLNQGLVIIQTYDTKNRILQQVLQQDYLGMVDSELSERKLHQYPPYYRIIKIDIKHKDASKLYSIASGFAQSLKIHLQDAVLGPETPIISRIKSYYIQSIIIKIDKINHSLTKVKSIIKVESASFYQNKINKGAVLYIDVDPY